VLKEPNFHKTTPTKLKYFGFSERQLGMEES
jgi:hypothetical protein